MFVRNHFISGHIKNKQSSLEAAFMPIYANYFNPQILVVTVKELVLKTAK